MKSPIGRIQNKFRYQILLRIKPEIEKTVFDYVYLMLDENKLNGVTSFVEINPSNLS